MKKIRNPWLDAEYHCIGCSPKNPIGLKLNFFEDGDYLYTEWDGDTRFEGYLDVLHGGIQALMHDEICSWTVYVKCKSAGVTANLETRYRKPVNISKGKISLKARVVEQTTRITVIKSELFDGENVLCSESTAKFFVFPPEKATSTYAYPGIEAFYFD